MAFFRRAYLRAPGTYYTFIGVAEFETKTAWGAFKKKVKLHDFDGIEAYSRVEGLPEWKPYPSR